MTSRSTEAAMAVDEETSWEKKSGGTKKPVEVAIACNVHRVCWGGQQNGHYNAKPRLLLTGSSDVYDQRHRGPKPPTAEGDENDDTNILIPGRNLSNRPSECVYFNKITPSVTRTAAANLRPSLPLSLKKITASITVTITDACRIVPTWAVFPP